MGVISDVIGSWLEETKSMIQENLSRTGTNASGETSNSLSVETTEKGGKLTGRSFFRTVETGRRPGKMPPVSKIKEWLETGKVSFSGSIDSAAWAISTAIAKRGTKLFRDGGREDIIQPAISVQRIDKLTKAIADSYTDQVVARIKTLNDG